MNDLNKKAKLLGISIAAVGLFALNATTAQAAPIYGSISFGGTVKVQNSSGVDLTSDKSTGAKIVFVNAKTGDQTQDGAFSSVGDGTAVTFKSPFVYAPVNPPVNNLWSVGGFNFNLTSWTFTNTKNTVAIDGYGTVSGNGYDATDNVAFNLSTQASGIAKVTFSASSSSVPVPAALFFAAPALLGVFGVSRRKNAAGLAA